MKIAYSFTLSNDITLSFSNLRWPLIEIIREQNSNFESIHDSVSITWLTNIYGKITAGIKLEAIALQPANRQANKSHFL